MVKEYKVVLDNETLYIDQELAEALGWGFGNTMVSPGSSEVVVPPTTRSSLEAKDIVSEASTNADPLTVSIVLPTSTAVEPMAETRIPPTFATFVEEDLESLVTTEVESDNIIVVGMEDAEH